MATSRASPATAATRMRARTFPEQGRPSKHNNLVGFPATTAQSNFDPAGESLTGRRGDGGDPQVRPAAQAAANRFVRRRGLAGPVRPLPASALGRRRDLPCFNSSTSPLSANVIVDLRIGALGLGRGRCAARSSAPGSYRVEVPRSIISSAGRRGEPDRVRTRRRRRGADAPPHGGAERSSTRFSAQLRRYPTGDGVGDLPE